MNLLKNKKVLFVLVMVLIAFFSFFQLGNRFSDPAKYKQLMSSIDKKTGDALRITGTATLASAALTLLPDDVATPIADKLAEFTQYFMVALCVLLAEKYMLPLIGFAVFKILIPLLCVLWIVRMFADKEKDASRFLTMLVTRLAIFGIILFCAVPASIKSSDMIYDTYRDSIEGTIRESDELTADISIFSDSNGTTFVERATNLVRSLLESLAVTIATSCVIPVLVLVCLVWLGRIIFSTVQAKDHIFLIPEKKQGEVAETES